MDRTRTVVEIECAVCRVVLTVSSHHQTVLLCPPCQARRCVVSRANPYPIVTPFLESTSASTVAYTYPDLAVDPDESVHGDSPHQHPGCTDDMRAGLVRHRSPPRAQERMPGRPPDLVRAPSSRQAVLDIVGATEGGVESESEVELVYPEDVPVATRELRSDESKPAEDEDAELELLYPEDAAQTMQMPSPKLQAKPPTTLREFFTGGLHSIPTSSGLAALADQGPPRRCRVPGCNEVLPSQSRMERCVKCSINDWKQRKLASVDASDRSPSPSINSPATNVSMEEKHVTTVLDDMSEAEDTNELPSLSRSLSKNAGIGPVPGWDSDLTKLSSSDIESESTSESDPDSDSGTPVSDGDSLRRKCGNKRCNIALPNNHRWKTCDPCRRAQRSYQRARLENIRRSIIGLEPLEPPEHLCRRWRSPSPEMCDMDTALTFESSRPCSTKRCGRRIPLPEVYRWKTCVGCRAQGRRKARRKRDADIDVQRAPGAPEIVPRFPAYQNRVALLSSLDALLKAFVEGQIMYLRAKLHEGGGLDGNSRQPQHVPMIFVFVGEYSIVTGQRDDDDDDPGDAKPSDGLAALDAMRKEVSSVVLDLERVLRTKFSAGEAFAIDKGGLIMRFTCSLELVAQLRPLTTSVGSSPGPRASTGDDDDIKGRDAFCGGEALGVTSPPKLPVVPLVKTLSGELEAVIVPDESHRLFHGRRTVIRYYMFG